MPIKINCENRNKKRRIDLGKIEKIARKTLRLLKKTNAEINIVFFSNQKIRAINRLFLGKDESTDVIAFPSDEKIGPDRAFLGDIAVSSDKAFRNAAEYGTAFTEEAALYVIHGILHLTGYDDRTEKDGEIMRRKEDELSQKTKALL
ncbi:MAG: rRNA maturation RNase YbeY [Candidatus Omnitrophota bacterium]|jgi:probable rRNA maturation factor